MNKFHAKSQLIPRQKKRKEQFVIQLPEGWGNAIIAERLIRFMTKYTKNFDFDFDGRWRRQPKHKYFSRSS